MLKCESKLRERRVSSAAITSTLRKTSSALKVMSPRLPIGVGTKYTMRGTESLTGTAYPLQAKAHAAQSSFHSGLLEHDWIKGDGDSRFHG